ncbi:EpsI family protein [Sphingobium phenoxybenzoativorans]|uniref:EpsI family protein n=1 Tax=Sphingobium phenoxybenzoativorans TaxID=1592790 RepID=A0A975Q175_9SPHN|nr:exosortase C-terminal domain/associated protein EpsI [Sphingobium phenoxybenzoativorans]QUT05650.1 EpsI family protein [Sphingobium phenoxybenzoativorans]
MPDRRQFLTGSALIAASGAAFIFQPRKDQTALSRSAIDGSVPRKIGFYRQTDARSLISVPENELSRKLYDQVLTRLYMADGLFPIMLVIAYSGAQDGDLSIHRPEICYASAGYALSPTQILPLSGLERPEAACFLSATRWGKTEKIYYWSRIGDAFPTNMRDEKLDILRANMKGEKPAGILVRMSVLSTESLEAQRQLILFNRALLSNLPTTGKALLLGMNAA